MSVLREISRSERENRRRRRDEVNSPDEVIIAKRGRREMPQTPPRTCPPLCSSLSVSSIASNQENDSGRVSPLTKCLLSMSSSPRVDIRPTKSGYNLRRRLFSPGNPSPSKELSASTELQFYYSPNSKKLRRSDATEVLVSLRDSGIDMISPDITEEQKITPAVLKIKKIKKSKLSNMFDKSTSSRMSSSKKSVKKNSTLVNCARRRLCF